MTKFQGIFISQNMTLSYGGDDNHDPLTRSAIAPLVIIVTNKFTQPRTVFSNTANSNPAPFVHRNEREKEFNYSRCRRRRRHYAVVVAAAFPLPECYLARSPKTFCLGLSPLLNSMLFCTTNTFWSQYPRFQQARNQLECPVLALQLRQAGV